MFKKITLILYTDKLEYNKRLEYTT